jgi:hypothetical protein
LDNYELVTFKFGSKLHGQWGPRLRRSIHSGCIELPWHSSGLPGCSSWFLGILGTEVDDAWDGSWRHCFAMLVYLVAKPVDVGVDVDGLAYPLHHPMTCGRQSRG